jgi:hypothetical protein
VIPEGEGAIELTDQNEIVFLKMVIEERLSGSSLIIPEKSAGKTYERTRTMREGQPAIRYELN